MINEQSDTFAKDGTKLGDFVLLMGSTPMYGRVTHIKRKFVKKNRYNNYQKGTKVGDELDSTLTVERILNLDLTKPKRTSRAIVRWPRYYVAIDKEFVKKTFRKLNNAVAYVRMINEQEGLI